MEDKDKDEIKEDVGTEKEEDIIALIKEMEEKFNETFKELAKK